MSSLFDVDQTTVTSEEFRVMQDRSNDMADEAKNFCETLWRRYERYADNHFLNEIKLENKFHDRFWEMHLGNVLLEKGFEIFSKDNGPDFRIQINEENDVWIEAITSSDGEEGRVDSVTSLQVSREASLVSEDKVVLRLRNAIESKSEKIKKYLDDGVVSNNEPIVIAINTAKINSIINYEDLIRYAQMSCFGVTSEYILNLKNGKFSQVYTSDITKSSGSSVPVNIFLNQNYSHISGILLSRASINHYDRRLGEDYVLVLNPYARNKLPVKAYEVAHTVLVHSFDSFVKKQKPRKKTFRFKNHSRRFEKLKKNGYCFL